MIDDLFAIYGTGGCGRTILPFAREFLKSKKISLQSLFFIDDNEKSNSVNGHKVMRPNHFFSLKAKRYYICIAISDVKIRKKIVNKTIKDNILHWDLKSKNCVIMDDVKIDEGCVLSPYVTLTSNIRIGKCFHANLYSYVEHDCIIGNFVTFAPGVKCNGNVEIGDNTFIGSGAIIKQGKTNKKLKIGKNVVIGMGSVVISDIPDNSTFIGNPAKRLVK